MFRFITGWFGPKTQKREKFVTEMFCLSCGRIWKAERLNLPCPKCASNTIIPAAKWAPTLYGMPKLDRGKVKKS